MGIVALNIARGDIDDIVVVDVAAAFRRQVRNYSARWHLLLSSRIMGPK
jgi:hypothetical protein